MSFDALAWAAKCRIPRSADKLVLLGLAECANRQTDVAFPSIEALIEFSSLNRKTVITALGRLEEAQLIEDTGERCGRTKQIKVYRLFVGRSPKTEQSQNRNHSNFSAEESQKRDTEPLREPLPPSEAIASAAPTGGQQQLDLETKPAKAREKRGQRLPTDWTPPPVTDLPLTVQVVLRQWPPGAYEFVAAQFAAHWAGESSAKARKVDWNAAWVKWVTTESAAILRAAKQGQKFTAPTPAAPGLSDEAKALIAMRPKEDAAALREHLRREMGEQSYTAWLHPTFIKITDDRVTVTVQSLFTADWFRGNFVDLIGECELHLSGRAKEVRVEVWR